MAVSEKDDTQYEGTWLGGARGEASVRDIDTIEVSAGFAKPYLYADAQGGKEGGKPVQYMVPMCCSAPNIPADRVEWRYRKKSWPSNNWCEFDETGWRTQLPIRAGGYLIVQARTNSIGWGKGPWSRAKYVFCDALGKIRVEREENVPMVKEE